MTQDANTTTEQAAVTTSDATIIRREELTIAKEHWKAEVAGAPRNRVQWALIGKAFVLLKDDYAFNNQGKALPNKEVKAFRELHFPGLRNELASYAQKLHLNFQAVEAFALANCPDLSTPKHLVSKWEASIRKSEQAPETPETADHQSIEKARQDALKALYESFLNVAEKLAESLAVSTTGLEPANLAMIRSKALALVNVTPEQAPEQDEVTEQAQAA